MANLFKELVVACGGSLSGHQKVVSVSVHRVALTFISVESNPSAQEAHEVIAKAKSGIVVACLDNYFDWSALESNLHPGILPTGGMVVPFFPRDSEAVSAGRISILELIDLKWWQFYGEKRKWIETEYSGGSSHRNSTVVRTLETEAINLVSDTHGGSIRPLEHPHQQAVTQRIMSGENVILYGNSSSGKTFMIASVIAKLRAANYRVLYVNLSKYKWSHAGLLLELVHLPFDGPCCMITDDVQSNPGAAAYISQTIFALNKTSLHSSSIVAVVWPEYLEATTQFIADGKLFHASPNAISGALIRRYEAKIESDRLNELRDKCGSDLALLALSLELISGNPEARLRDVAERLWMNCLVNSYSGSTTLKQVALIIASMGRFDISVPEDYVLSAAAGTREDIDALCRAGLVRRVLDRLTFGHRSIAGLFADWFEAEGVWTALAGAQGPSSSVDCVMRYARELSINEVVQLVRGLEARVGFRKSDSSGRRTNALVDVWTSFSTILDRMAAQQERDPSWGNSAGGMMFAIQAFTLLGQPELASRSIAVLRSRYRDSMPVVAAQDFVEVKDFSEIAKRMFEEDGGIEAANADVDIARANENWLAGVALTAEGEFGSEPDDVEGLLAFTKREQLESGAFYPERITWITSRIVLGLALLGLNALSSVEMKRAIDWLQLPEAAGGPFSGDSWHSGTGTWNSELEATAMVVLAMTTAGVQNADDAINSARQYLLSTKSEWTLPGHEIDGTLALHAYLASGGLWMSVASEAQFLAKWARSEALWQEVPANMVGDATKQACRVAQVAYHLINVAWAAIDADLEGLLASLQVPALYRDEMVRAGPIEGSKAETSDPRSNLAAAFLQGIRTLDLEAQTVIGSYRRFSESTRSDLRKWAAAIADSISQMSSTRENYVVWAPPGSGKSFFVQEIAKAHQSSISYVEINIARDPKEDIVARLKQVADSEGSILCMLDEIDGRSSETWVYNDIFSSLDLNLQSASQKVFVLVGSSKDDLSEMILAMQQREKGKDLLDRVPAGNRFEIPAPDFGDLLSIFASHVVRIGASSNIVVERIEKMAAFFVLTADNLNTPRQMADLAERAVLSMSRNDKTLRYDCLFRRGDTRNQQFWLRHAQQAERLSGEELLIRWDS